MTSTIFYECPNFSVLKPPSSIIRKAIPKDSPTPVKVSLAQKQKPVFPIRPSFLSLLMSRLLPAQCHKYLLQAQLLDTHIITLRTLLSRFKEHCHSFASTQMLLMMNLQPFYGPVHLILMSADVKTAIQQVLCIFF